MSYKAYKFNGMRYCDKCKKYVYCNPSIGPCGMYTMKDHLESVCEANRTPCEKCGIFLNNDEISTHLSDYCIGNTVTCDACNTVCYQGRFEYHKTVDCKKK